MNDPLRDIDQVAKLEAPIVAGLAQAGYKISSIADLRRSGLRYRDAIPILLSALSAVSDHKTLMEIIRALGVPWAKPEATSPLIELFQQVDDSTGLGLRWAIGNALEVVWDDVDFDRLVALILEQSYGRAREMLVLGLGRSKRPEAVGLLIELLADYEVSGHAVKALRRIKPPEARSGLEKMLSDDRAWVRKEAEQALSALK